MSGLTTVTAYTVLPVTDTDVKRALRIPTSDSTHDTLIGTCRSAATKIVMELTQRTLTQETLKLGLDAYPYGYGFADDNSLPYTEGITVGPYQDRIGRAIYLPRPPVTSVTHVKTYDDDDTATTLASSKYYVDLQSPIPRVILRTGETWDNLLRVANAIEVTYVAGYGTSASDVPQAIKSAIVTLSVNYFENPEPIIKGESATRISGLVESLIRPFRVSRFGIGFS
jgi:uncharacterized phiE125 gp8 family phage protein|tara:strand:- start:1911 stop:2588 length:678 start_codon:yes stop_codon:yes gene_type:complete